jgi:hypothetical protein
MDGSGTPTEFHVTASNDTEDADDGANISMGMGSTNSHGAFDVDFFAYKPGVITPAPSNPNLARALNPPVGVTVALSDATPLSWTPGITAAKHDVYFGTNQADVNDADASDTTGIYQGQQPLPIFNPPEALELGQTYYWRIDEVEANDTIHKGGVWSFTILDHIPIDDMEDYNDDDNKIWQAWKDGEGWTDPPPGWPGNGSGAVMGIGTDVAQGFQSLSYSYDNDGTNSLGTTGKAYYSEAKMTLSDSRDWTASGVKALSLMFIGYPEDVGNFKEGPAGTYTVTSAGADIEDQSDEFHFAYKVLNGAGSIIAKVESVENTHEWAKAGVMIRDTLDVDSVHTMIVVTPGNGVSFQRRILAGSGSVSDTQGGIAAPYWVKLERTIGGAVRASYSADGSTWEPLGGLTPVTMNLPMYIGLAVTSHEPGVACEAVFTNVTSDGTGAWINEDIGITSNGAESMYVAISNNNGTTGTVYYDDNDNVDPNATLIDEWTEWNIDLKDFSDQGVDLTDVNNIAIGFGTKDNTIPGPSGQMYIDDIRLYQPRYIADKVTPFEADFTDNGIVDHRDLWIMVNDWLQGDYTVYAETTQSPIVWWKFDEGSGTTAGDSSGNSNNGAFSGTATWATGKDGGFAAAFDGGVGEVRGAITSLNGLSAMSFGAWVKSNSTGTDAGFIIFDDPNGNDQRDLRYDSAGNDGGGINVIKYGVATEEDTVEDSHENESASNVQTTDWQHLMVTWNSGEAAKLFINGVLDTPTSVDDVIGGTTTGYSALIVGRGGKDEDGSWDGLVDDVRVYDYALSANEVVSAMDLSELYVPLTSQANISDEEPANSKKVNFKDFAVLADQWLEELVWPSW